MSAMVRAGFQLTFAAFMSCVLWVELVVIPMRIASCVGKFLFLTCQTLAIVTMYACGNAVCECSRLLLRRRLERLERSLGWAHCAVAGLAAFVLIMFYATCWFDPKYQERIRVFEAEGLPMGFYSHLLHVPAVPFMFADALLARRAPMLQAIGKVRDYTAFFVAYGVVLTLLWDTNNRIHGTWPYPFLERMTTTQRLLFYVAALGFAELLTIAWRSAMHQLPLSAGSDEAPARPRTRSQAVKHKPA